MFLLMLLFGCSADIITESDCTEPTESVVLPGEFDPAIVNMGEHDPDPDVMWCRDVDDMTRVQCVDADWWYSDAGEVIAECPALDEGVPFGWILVE